MLIIGESLNAAIPSVGQAISARDSQAVADLALQQVDGGAQMLDVNAGGLAGRDEVADLVWLVQAVQETVTVPLMLDSNNPEALAAAIRAYRGPRPILSSASGEPGRAERLLPLAVEQNSGLVILCMDEKGIPPTPDGRVAVAERLIDQALSTGLRAEDLYIDPLVMTVSADYRAGAVTLATLSNIRERFPQVRTVCGVSNIAFGLPQRRLMNRTFAAMLAGLGLDAFIVDVRDRELLNTLLAVPTLTGQDPYCRQYLKAYRAGRFGIK